MTAYQGWGSDGAKSALFEKMQISLYKKNNPPVYDLQFLQQKMFVIPVTFSEKHNNLLAHCKQMPEYNNGIVAIQHRFTKLITALRTAVENREGYLDKVTTLHDDLFDAFRLSPAVLVLTNYVQID